MKEHESIVEDKIAQIIAVTDYDSNRLAAIVTQKIAEGWILHGTVFMQDQGKQGEHVWMWTQFLKRGE